MFKASLLMMLPFPRLTQATMTITKFMVRQRMNHWKELRNARLLVMLNGSSLRWQIVSSTIRNILWKSSLEN